MGCMRIFKLRCCFGSATSTEHCALRGQIPAQPSCSQQGNNQMLRYAPRSRVNERRIMKKYSKILSAGMLFLVFSQAHAGEVLFPQCPQKLPIAQQVVRGTPVDSWKIVNNTNTQYLRDIAISAGEHPKEQMVFQAPTETKKLSKGDMIYFHDYIVPSTSGIYNLVVCEYMNTGIFLVKKLPESVVRCEVKHINDVTVPERITIKCFDTPRKTK